MMMVARKLKKKVYKHNPGVCIKESCIHTYVGNGEPVLPIRINSELAVSSSPSFYHASHPTFSHFHAL
jgi:hypothetical protein